jgi:hypothetical protein
LGAARLRFGYGTSGGGPAAGSPTAPVTRSKETATPCGWSFALTVRDSGAKRRRCPLTRESRPFGTALS